MNHTFSVTHKSLSSSIGSIAIAVTLVLGMNSVVEAGVVPYYVATQAIADAGTPSAQYQYNIDSNNLGIRSNVGTQAFVTPLNNCPECGGSQGGSDLNSTSNPLLTTSYDQAVASLPKGYLGTYLVDLNWNATSSANASLAAGAIGITATGIGDLYGNQGGNSQAQSYLQDQLNFNIAGANSNTITDIGVQFVINGSFSLNGESAANASVRAIDSIGNAVIDTTVNDNNNPLGATPTIAGFSQSGWVSYSLTDSNPNQITFSGIYAVQGATPSLGFSMYISGGAMFGGSTNYSNSVQFTLPTGVSFASDSGVFLTSPTTVPVPSAVWLFGSTIAGFGMYGRRKSASA